MSEAELLARLIKCEAGGEGLVGMAAVASVIANRVRTLEGEYGRYNTVNDVAYAPRQFECVTGYNPTQNIWSVMPEVIHYELAQWALTGGRLGQLSNTLWFFNPFQTVCPNNFPTKVGYLNTRIGDHCFYDPNPSYRNT